MKTQREDISEMKEAKRIEKRHLMNCRLAPQEHPEQQVEVVVKIRRANG
jgi:hypothetical protein